MSRTPSPPTEMEPVVAVLLGRARELWDGMARRVRAEIPCYGGDEAAYKRLDDACRPNTELAFGELASAATTTSVPQSQQPSSSGSEGDRRDKS
ncbi:hypothetical protein [Streptomyces gardneri]|uniref:hypothetical protein n=1 Tax=Streptomyces gardneri TaxID=66892 RepID=UPI00114129D9|nr:hypothetical protein [Streptomyces gardneri]